MNPRHDQTEAAWQRILPHVRATRRRRRNLRIAAVMASCVLLGAWLALQPAKQLDPPVARKSDPVPPVHETIAVMRFREDGNVRLEEVSCQDLGAIELAFGLTPVIAHDWEIW